MEKQLKDHKALSPNYDGIPLRYENSKPVQTQIYTHQNILDIGRNIHTQWETKAEDEKDQAIAAAQGKVWMEAEHVKQVMLEKCRAHAKKELDTAVRNLQQTHAKSLKEELLRVEGILTQQTTEQVHQEKEAGEKTLREAVGRLQAQYRQEKLEAVAQARKEEVGIAREEAGRVSRLRDEREAETAKCAARDKADALGALKNAMTQETADAKARVRREERETAARELGRVKASHEDETRRLLGTIRELESRNEETLVQVDQEHREKLGLEAKYEELKTSYQLFINKTKGFNQGQADFLL